MTGKSKRTHAPMPVDDEPPSERDVPCNGCTACCYGEIIALFPEQGDDLARYGNQVIWRPNPINGEIVPMMRKRSDGACVWLVPGQGCGVYEHRPVVCKSFDCRRIYLRYRENLSPTQIKQALRRGGISKDVWRAAKDRLHTLEQD